MTAPDRLGRLLGNEAGGVFYLHGDDEFQKDEAARRLVEAHLDPATADFNLDRLRGSEVDVETLASVLGTPPMMAEWRVVVVRETEALASSKRTRDALLEVVASPPPGLALILLCSVPRRSSAKFYRELARGTRALEFRSVSVDDIPGWLMSRAEESFGRTLHEDAARALGAGVGTDLAVLAQELEKLDTLVPEGEPITLARVEAAGTRVPRQDRWAWFDLVGERRFEEALGGLPVLLDHGESGVGLTVGLATHLLRIGVVVEGGRNALQEALPPHQRWLADRFGRQASGWGSGEVEAAVEGLLLVDRLLKSSPLPAEHHLESWLLGRAFDGGAAQAGVGSVSL
ncbi:MAG: DNA polymerase III subunit delta [Gemmatimonadota bacterium]